MMNGLTKKQVAAARRDLKRLTSGAVLDADDHDFNVTVTLDNGRIRRPPHLVAMPSSTGDIAATVKYCRSHGIRITTKSGGHGGSGYCLNSHGIVIDLAALNSIQPHDGGARLTVEMGARWNDVYNHVQRTRNDHIAVGGGCGAVGVGGFLLGGGYSFISRSYGLGCDSITSMDVVTAGGDIYHLDQNVSGANEKDLYWALRGSGGGNFGIVSQVDLALHKQPSQAMLMGGVTFPLERSRELLHFYNEWVSTLPDEMAVYGMLRRFPDPRHGGDSVLSLRFSATFNGPFPEGVALLAPLMNHSPAIVELYRMTLPEWESFVGNGTMIAGRSAYIRSLAFSPGGLTSPVIEILVRHMSEAPSQDSYIVWTHTGGNIRNSAAAVASCFAHRDAQFVFELKSIWTGGGSNRARENIEWAVRFFDELDPYAQGAYLNYIDPFLDDWQLKYYRSSYPRLLKVKQHWDPDGRFDFQQGIGSPFAPAKTLPLDLSPLNKT